MTFSQLTRWTPVLVLSSLFLVFPCFAQRCQSVTVKGSANCANNYVEIQGITSGRLEGQINPIVDLPIVVTVYKSSKSDRKRSPYLAADTTYSVVSFEADENGRFCHSGLPDGYYIVKFGTYGGGWNCTWMKLHIVSGAAVVKVKIDLSIGT